MRFRDLYRNSPLGVVAVALSGMISSIIFSMGPVYARLSGAGTRGVAEFMAVSILAAVLTQYPVGRLSDRMDRRTVIASVCLLATAVAATQVAFAGLPRALFLVLTALFSGAALTLYSLSVSHVNDKLEPAQMVAASSALLLINGMAAAFGPVLTGGLMAEFGPRAYFGTLGTLTGALTLYDLWRKTRRRAVRGEPKAPFINTQQIVTCAGLDPAPVGGVEPLVIPAPRRSRPQGQRRRLLDHRERDGGVDRLHARKARQVVEEERLVRLDVAAHDAQQEVRLAHERVALEDLRVGAHRLLEAQQRIAPVTGDLHVREHHHRQPDLLPIDECHAPFDDAALLEARDAPPAGRGGQAQPLGHLGRRQRAVLLQQLEDPQVCTVEISLHDSIH